MDQIFTIGLILLAFCKTDSRVLNDIIREFDSHWLPHTSAIITKLILSFNITTEFVFLLMPYDSDLGLKGDKLFK